MITFKCLYRYIFRIMVLEKIVERLTVGVIEVRQPLQEKSSNIFCATANQKGFWGVFFFLFFLCTATYFLRL